MYEVRWTLTRRHPIAYSPFGQKLRFCPNCLTPSAVLYDLNASTPAARGGGELGIFIALVAVLDRTVVDDFDAEGNELLTGHDEPWVVEFAAKSDDLCQEPG